MHFYCVITLLIYLFKLLLLVLADAVVVTDLYEVPDAVPPIHAVSSHVIHAVSSHVATDKTPPSSGLFLAIIYNQSQLAERKQVARCWSISAVPESAHPPALVITTKLAAAILLVAVVSNG